MPKVVGSLINRPTRVSFIWYACVILLGAGLLATPLCRADGAAPISPLDALFTATSSLCVTGLAVRSTGADFSLLGQLVILGLIQLGGIGIMTVTTFVTFALGGRESLRLRAVLDESLGAGGEPNLRWILARVILLAAAFELGGFVLLAIRFAFDLPLADALWHALFHSISAFCNAGFSLWDDSLTAYQGDVLVNVTVMMLILCGGLGFPVLMDVGRNWKHPRGERWQRLTLHSKIMIVGTAALIALGAAAVLILEWGDALADMSVPRKLMTSLFHSVTCRTAGFNTLDIGLLTNATLFVSLLLMAIGGGPCSTAGGFKVSTLAVLLLRGWANFRGHRQVFVSRRTIPPSVVNRSFATAVLFSGIGAFALTWLLALEQSETPHADSQGLFMDAMFEVVSALGTVGLSTGMTTHLTTAGRAIVIVLMFMGRLGPITVFAALSRSEQLEPTEYAEEEPLVG